MFIVVIVAVKCLRIVIDYMKDINFIIIAMNLENNMVCHSFVEYYSHLLISSYMLNNVPITCLWMFKRRCIEMYILYVGV